MDMLTSGTCLKSTLYSRFTAEALMDFCNVCLCTGWHVRPDTSLLVIFLSIDDMLISVDAWSDVNLHTLCVSLLAQTSVITA